MKWEVKKLGDICVISTGNSNTEQEDETILSYSTAISKEAVAEIAKSLEETFFLVTLKEEEITEFDLIITTGLTK